MNPLSTFFNRFFGPLAPPPPHEPIPDYDSAPPLECPLCNLPLSWDQLELTPSKKTYTCTTCPTTFCIFCKEQSPALAEGDRPAPCQNGCLLDPEYPCALLTLLLFHETLTELQGLRKIKERFWLLKGKYDGLEFGPSEMERGRVEEAIGKTEVLMEMLRGIAGDLYGMMSVIGEGKEL